MLTMAVGHSDDVDAGLAIDAAIDRAGSAGRTVVLAPTAPGDPLFGPASAEQARERAAGLVPQPYAPDRNALLEKLDAASLQEQRRITVPFIRRITGAPP